jgi:hypothetical protein
MKDRFLDNAVHFNLRYPLLKAQCMAATKTEFVELKKSVYCAGRSEVKATQSYSHQKYGTIMQENEWANSENDFRLMIENDGRLQVVDVFKAISDSRFYYMMSQLVR